MAMLKKAPKNSAPFTPRLRYEVGPECCDPGPRGRGSRALCRQPERLLREVAGGERDILFNRETKQGGLPPCGDAVVSAPGAYRGKAQPEIAGKLHHPAEPLNDV